MADKSDIPIYVDHFSDCKIAAGMLIAPILRIPSSISESKITFTFDIMSRIHVYVRKIYLSYIECINDTQVML